MLKKLTLAGGLLILVNLSFLVGGILLLRFKSTLESSGWTDALDNTDYEYAAHTATWMLQLLGIAAIALAIVGIIGAIVQNRLLLLLYAIVVMIAMVVFGVLAAIAFTFRAKMKTYDEAAYPVDDREVVVANTFNQVYCYAEGYYYCNNATAKEAYTTFFPDAPSELLGLLPNVTGIVSLCGQLSSTVSGLQTVCEACNMSTTFAKYDRILMWAEDKCPRTAVTGQWCASFLATGAPGEVYNGAPYGQCRAIFFGVAIDWSTTMATAGVLLAVAALVIIIMTCFTRRSKERVTYNYDGGEVKIETSN
uniref:Tetraspanin n=1 Tax=Peronospora matthiolae TaxID=2874970 RepID=A0AAV1ULZ2_9STRA